MKLLFVRFAVLASLTWSALPAFAAEATFERTVTFAEQAEISVTTGSGYIHLSQGPGGQIRIVGHVRSYRSASDDRVRAVAARPPIAQVGNIVRVGPPLDDLQGVTIDYEIQAPANTYLDATTGSGGIDDRGVGSSARLHTGSGQIHAAALRGDFSLRTGSGDIDAEQMGEGNVQAQTGSGNIVLHNLDGELDARSGSGNIHARGNPAGPWRIQTGSGDVEIWTADAAFQLDASCGSGSIQADRPLTVQLQSKHRLRAQFGSDGPLVHIETGSGNIRIHR